MVNNSIAHHLTVKGAMHQRSITDLEVQIACNVTDDIDDIPL